MAETPPLFACLPPRDAGPDAVLEGFLRYVETLGLTLYPHQDEAILALMTGRCPRFATKACFSCPSGTSLCARPPGP